MREIALTRTRWGTGLVVALLLVGTLDGRPARAGTVDEGRPLVRAFSPADLESASSAERLVVAPDGSLVAACGGDVVVYDGARVERVVTSIPRVRALGFSKNGARLYAGGDGGFGVVERGPAGSRSYRSLATEDAPVARVAGIAVAGDVVWVSTGTALLRLEGLYLRELSVEGTGPLAVFAAGDTAFVHRQERGLFRIDAGRPVAVTSDPLVAGAALAGVFADDAGITVASTRHGLIRLTGARAQVLREDAIASAADDPAGGYVLGLERGGVVLVSSTGASRRALGPSDGLPDRAVTSVAIDRDGSLWAATPEAVVQVALPSAVSRFDARDGLPRAAISAVARHQGRLVVAADEGLYALRTGAGFERIGDALPRPHDLLGTRDALYASGRGGIWRVEGQEAVKVFAAADEVTDLASWSGDPDVILAARTSGLSVLRREADRLVEIRRIGDFGAVGSIVDEGAVGIWLGAAGGVHRIVVGPGSDAATWETARVVTYDSKNGKLLEADGSVAVEAGPGGVLAVGTTHVHRYEAAADAFRPDDRFTLDGTPLNRLRRVAVSSPQRFWTSASVHAHRSDFPLAHFDRAPGGVWKLVPAPTPILEGLGAPGATSIFLEASGSDEIVWAAGFGELYRISVAGLPAPPVRPVIAITAASGGGRAHRVVGMGRQGYLDRRIGHAREPIRFAFGAPSLLPGSRVEYRWRLEEWDEAWSAWSTSGEAVFTALPRGHYRLVVEGRDRAGTSAHSAAVRFKTAPAPWLSWWAWTGYLLAGAGAFWGAVRLRVLRSVTQVKRLEEIIAERTSEAAAARETAEETARANNRFLLRMSEELRAPLDGIARFADGLAREPELTSRHRDSLESIQASGHRLRALVDEIAELSRVEAGYAELHDATFSLAALIRDVETAFVAQARERGLGFHVATRDLPRAAVVGDAQRIRQVLEHLVGGAMRLTERGEVRLTVIGEPRSGTVHFAVSDTGPGVTPEEPESELGLAMSRQIVELMGSRLEVAGCPGEGSTAHFSIVLPEAEEEPRRVAPRGWLDATRLTPGTPRRPGT